MLGARSMEAQNLERIKNFFTGANIASHDVLIFQVGKYLKIQWNMKYFK